MVSQKCIYIIDQKEEEEKKIVLFLNMLVTKWEYCFLINRKVYENVIFTIFCFRGLEIQENDVNESI